MRRVWAVTAACAVLAGCTVGPNYKRPAVPVPDQYRGAEENGSKISIADTKWFELFQDDTLKDLVSTALDHNFDLGIATERIQEARAQYHITRADQFPFASLQSTLASQRQSSVGSIRFIGAGTDLS
jgi:multidrug efflux system outer membrane protein